MRTGIPSLVPQSLPELVNGDGSNSPRDASPERYIMHMIKSRSDG